MTFSCADGTWTPRATSKCPERLREARAGSDAGPPPGRLPSVSGLLPVHARGDWSPDAISAHGRRGPEPLALRAARGVCRSLDLAASWQGPTTEFGIGPGPSEESGPT